MRPTSAADDREPPQDRIVVATALQPELEDELERVSWRLTIWRLAVEPHQHPWKRGWRFLRRGPLYAVLLAVLLLLLFAASGCASAPTQSLFLRTTSPAPAGGAHCESVLISHELQIPPQGDLADVRLTIEDIPETLGKLRLLVRRPRFASTLQLEADQKPEFDKVLQISLGAGQRQLTIVLQRPGDAARDWPRGSCKACRVDVEVTGLFGVREGLDAFFARALQDATATESAFSAQSGERAERPSTAVRQLAGGLTAEANRCAVPLEAALVAVQRALEQLDGARARLYAGDKPELPDAGAVLRDWDAVGVALEALPLATSARAYGWPASLRPRSAGRLRQSALHLDLALQAAALPPEDKALAAQWIAVATAPDLAALERRITRLPRIRDLADAASRLDWVDPHGDVPVRVPGISRAATLRVREWRAARHGRRCIGPLGAAPVRDPDDDARAVADLLGADDRQRIRVARPEDLRATRHRLRQARELLCKPLTADVTDLFTGLEQKDLGAVSERLAAIHAEVDPRRESDELARAISAQTADLVCKLFDPERVQRRIASVVGYKIFVEGGTHVLDFLSVPLVCDGHVVPTREIRGRLRDAYRAALDRHAVADRLCPVRAGKCPDEVASSVRRVFSLQRPELAAPGPARTRTLDFPPPFGFSDAWVAKLDRCGREACEALSQLRNDAPAGQFDGAVCAPRREGAEQPQEVTIDRPEAPTSVTLSTCDANAGVRLTLRRRPDAGTLVSIASSQQFRYGSENVSRHGRHPQLGRIYERVADLTDPGDVSRRADGAIEVALTPTVENQVFYFFSLRRRDY